MALRSMAVSKGKAAYKGGGAVDIDFMKFESSQRRISEAESRLREEQKESEKRLNATCERIESKLDAAVERLDAKIDALEAKFEAKFDALEAKFDAKIDALDAKFEAKFSRLESKFETFQMWMMGIAITMIIGFIGMFATIMLTR